MSFSVRHLINNLDSGILYLKNSSDRKTKENEYRTDICF